MFHILLSILAVPDLCSLEGPVGIQPCEEKAGLGRGGGNGSSGNVSVYLLAVSLMDLREHLHPRADLSQLISECPGKGRWGL